MLDDVKDGYGFTGGVVKDDPVNPSHYNGDACMKAIEECTKGLDGPEGYLTGVIIKYLWRWKQKNGVEDLEKAMWYLNRLTNTVAAANFIKMINDPAPFTVSSTTKVNNLNADACDGLDRDGDDCCAEDETDRVRNGHYIKCGKCSRDMLVLENTTYVVCSCGQGHNIERLRNGAFVINPA